MATCIVLKCYFMNPAVCQVPVWVRIVVITWMGRLMRVKIPPGLSKLRAKHKESVEQNHKDREVKRLRSKSIVSDKIDNISRKQSVICPDSPDHTLLNGDAKHKVSFIYSPANHGPLLTDNFTLSRDRADTMLSVTSDPWKRLSQEVNSYPHETSDHQVDASLNLSQLSPVTQALLRGKKNRILYWTMLNHW